MTRPALREVPWRLLALLLPAAVAMAAIVVLVVDGSAPAVWGGLGVLALSLAAALVCGRRDPGGFEPLGLLSAGLLLCTVLRAIGMLNTIASSGGQVAGDPPGPAAEYAALFGASALLGAASLVRIHRSGGARRGRWLAWHSVIAAPFWFWVLAWAVLAEASMLRAPTMGWRFEPRVYLPFALASVAVVSALFARTVWRHLARLRPLRPLAVLPLLLGGWTAWHLIVMTGASLRTQPHRFVAPLSSTALPARSLWGDGLVLVLRPDGEVPFGYSRSFWDPTEPVPEDPRATLVEAEDEPEGPPRWLSVVREELAYHAERDEPPPPVVVHGGPERTFGELAPVLRALAAGEPRIDRVRLSVRRTARMPLTWIELVSGVWPRFPRSGVIAVGWAEEPPEPGRETLVLAAVPGAAPVDRPERVERAVAAGAERAVLRCAPAVTFQELVDALDAVRGAGILRVDLAGR